MTKWIVLSFVIPEVLVLGVLTYFAIFFSALRSMSRGSLAFSSMDFFTRLFRVPWPLGSFGFFTGLKTAIRKLS